MIEQIERMRKLVNDNLVMGLRFQMNRELNKLESEIEQELNAIAREEIVRCKDCVYLDVDGYCTLLEFIHGDISNKFCAWGERRKS